MLRDAVDVLVHHRVLNQLHALLDLHRVLLAHPDFAFERVPVAHAAPANLAVANCVHVGLTAVVLDPAVVGFLDGRRPTRSRFGAARSGIWRRRGILWRSWR